MSKSFPELILRWLLPAGSSWASALPGAGRGQGVGRKGLPEEEPQKKATGVMSSWPQWTLMQQGELLHAQLPS